MSRLTRGMDTRRTGNDRLTRFTALPTLLVGLGILTGQPCGAAITATLDLPPRQPDAMTGSAFYAHVQGMNDTAREQAIVQEIGSGNIPSFLRKLVPITISASGNTGVFYVTPDYMAIGSDEDFFRIPMSGPLAQQIADMAGCTLPTRKMVDAIYTASQVKLAPYTFSPANYDIDSIEVIWLHHQAVETQRAGQPLGRLVGGIKKDVVITPELTNRPAPARVAIYGWHQLNGNPIQPLSLVHEASYEDYSHGTRLIESTMLLNGEEIGVVDLLLNATLDGLLSDEATVFTSANVRYNIPSPHSEPIVGANLITDPHFESSFTNIASGWTAWGADGSGSFNTHGWAFTGPSGIINFSRTNAKGPGTYSQKWTLSGSGDGGVTRTVATTAGSQYLVSGWMKHGTGAQSPTMRFGIDLTGGSNPTADSVQYINIPQGPDNSFGEFTTLVTASGTAMTLFARGTAASSAEFFLDDVSVITMPTELVVNGGFDLTFTNGVATGWTAWSAAGSNTITYGAASLNKVAGPYSQYWARNDTATFDGGVYQRIAVQPGVTYEIEAWMKRQSTIAGTSMRFGYDLTGGTDGTAGAVQYTDITGTNNVFNAYSTQVQATGSHITLFARGGHTGTTGGTNAYFYLDSVSLQPAN